MEQIPYINYKELDEFYTVGQLAGLLGITKQELKASCEQYGIKPRRNEIGDYGFVRFDVRKMIQNVELLAVKVGREYRIPIVSVREFIGHNCI